MNDWIYLIFITFLPGIELRGSIPAGVAAGYNPLLIFLVLTFVNILLIPPAFKFLDFFFHIMEKIKYMGYFIERTRKRAKKYVDKYGFIGLCLFVAVPLPGTGAYSGALAAHLFGMKNRKAFASIALGVAIAGVLVTVISTIGKEALGWIL